MLIGMLTVIAVAIGIILIEAGLVYGAVKIMSIVVK